MRTHHGLFVAAATCAALAWGSTPAHAQFRPGPDRIPGPDRTWNQSQGRAPYELGFQEGRRQGERDARANRAFDVYGDPAYRDGDRGYHRRFGDRNLYRNFYRSGFEDGYRAGYGRRGPVFGDRDRRPGGAGPRMPRAFPEPAVARGFNDGYEQGVRDGRDDDRYDPVASRDYREGDNGYNGSYRGTRDAYKTNYRAGFRQGYEEGYRDGGRYDRR